MVGYFALTQPHTAKWNDEFELLFDRAVASRSFVEGVIQYALAQANLIHRAATITTAWNTEMTRLVFMVQPKVDATAEQFDTFWSALDAYFQQGTPVRGDAKRLLDLPANQHGRVEVRRGDDTNPIEEKQQQVLELQAAYDKQSVYFVQNGTNMAGLALLGIGRALHNARGELAELEDAGR